MCFEGAAGPQHSRCNENEPVTSPREGTGGLSRHSGGAAGDDIWDVWSGRSNRGDAPSDAQPLRGSAGQWIGRDYQLRDPSVATTPAAIATSAKTPITSDPQ